MKIMFLGAVSLTCLLSSCASQPADPTAADVFILPQNRVTHCKTLGTTRVAVRNIVGIWKRYPTDVEADLADLARSKAAVAGADTVSPLTEPRNGKQTFNMYQCVDLKGGDAVNKHRKKANEKNRNDVEVIPYKPNKPAG